MLLPIIYPNTLKKLLLSGLLSLWIPSVQATQLNFSAVIAPATCTLSLSEEMINLGSLFAPSLQPATLVSAKPFTLAVTNCRGTQTVLTPVVSVTGDGAMQDGRWLFRSEDSAANNVGVMLVNSSVLPTYSSSEVKNGDTLPLATQAGLPTNQNLSFYAGATCGNAAGCTNVGVGTIVARIIFSLDYR